MVHGLVSVMERLQEEDGMLVFLVDFKNAFNVVKREVFIKEVLKHFPELYNLVSYLYCCEGRLILTNGTTILSKEGTQQGCTFGLLLYSLALNVMVQK